MSVNSIDGKETVISMIRVKSEEKRLKEEKSTTKMEMLHKEVLGDPYTQKRFEMGTTGTGTYQRREGASDM